MSSAATLDDAGANPRLGRILREAGWIVLAAIGAYLALVLATYHREDPGPFYTGTGGAVANHGGVAGAWLSEALLYVFGLSAWWWVVLALYGILRLYRRVETWELLNRRTLALMDVYGRVASTLLELSVYNNGKLMVGEKLSQQDLANMVGASREMVNRILKDLSDRGFISIESKAITIINRELPPSL